jgi:hypothetical protein
MTSTRYVFEIFESITEAARQIEELPDVRRPAPTDMVSDMVMFDSEELTGPYTFADPAEGDALLWEGINALHALAVAISTRSATEDECLAWMLEGSYRILLAVQHIIAPRCGYHLPPQRWVKNDARREPAPNGAQPSTDNSDVKRDGSIA